MNQAKHQAMGKAKQSWQEEKRAEYLYRIMAEHEPDPDKANLFLQLAGAASDQAALWANKLTEQGQTPGDFQPGLRIQCIARLVRLFGVRRLRPVLAASKIRGLSVYSGKRAQGTHPMPSDVHAVGASHRGMGNNGGLRAAVFGVNDGLVSIACLVFGVAGASAESSTILLTGIAGLMAGAFSMAAGEYVSMRSQREMFEYQINLEKEELALYPEEEARELALIYMARGLEPAEADALAKRMIADPQLGLDTLTREELGLNPDELGSPWIAAIASFVAFSLGGLVPLLPFMLGLGENALMQAVILTAIALWTVGATLSLFSGGSGWHGGLRMVLIGGGAGWVTYLLGMLLGVSIA